MNDVYLITNLVNGKRYVGITCRGYQARFKEHLIEAASGSKSILHHAIRKYGADNFKLELLESNVPDDSIGDRERYYITRYNTFYRSHTGYNMTEGGGGMSGYKHTPEARSKMSQSRQGHKFPESRNKKIQQAMLGRDYKPEWRKALSQSRMGRFTQADNPFFGKHHSAETKSKISAANTKYPVAQIDPVTGAVITIHTNLNEAGRYVVENKLSQSKIGTTCAGRIGEVCKSNNVECTAYGFKWRFEERSID